MSNKMELKLDPDLEFQLQAIRSVVDLFVGMDRRIVELRSEYGYGVVPNLPKGEHLFESDLIENLIEIQESNGISERERSDKLDVDDGMVLDFVGNDSVRYPSFTVEMETGTGKTYVYLRTIYELSEAYGFRKFIVVVPSVAIYEGVLKNFEIARSHFAALYNNMPIRLTGYDSSKMNQLRTFATSPFVEVMVMTLASFRVAYNRIFKPSESLPGERRPYEFIQEVRPILILDEPQNMRSERSKEALRTLKPLLALRYSATHRETPNLVYRLSPFDAFQRGLVKKIKVKGVTQADDFNAPLLALEEVVTMKGSKPKAKVRAYVQNNGRTSEEFLTLSQGDDLYNRTKRDEHKGNYVVAEISARRGDPQYVEFENGVRLTDEDSFGPSKREIFRVQIEETIERHMIMQDRLENRGIKVLSLFFIDKVDNYVPDDGLIRVLFEEAYEKVKGRFPFFREKAVEDVHGGYFAKMRNKETGEDEPVDTRIEEEDKLKAQKEAEKETYKLIMRDKERLLSFEEDLCFIFSHSALKEGWDNPNVFQICTLNQTVSKLKKRQEIGRGLRICVNQDGERVFDDNVNILTVIANESYERYASTLQREYAEDGYDQAPPPPTNAGREPAHLRDEKFQLDKFQEFWSNLGRQADYEISIETERLIQECIDRLNNRPFPKPNIVVESGDYVKTSIKMNLEEVQGGRAKINVSIEDTLGRREAVTDWYEPKNRLDSIDPRLRGFRVDGVDDGGPSPHVTFENDQTLSSHSPIQFETEEGQTVSKRAVLTEETNYPVFNLLERVVNEVGLTRVTVFEIFRQMVPEKKRLILKNPEGFAGIFLNTIQNALADHIAERLTFRLDPEMKEHDLKELFPSEKEFPQHELVETPSRALYSKTQIDSEVERRFVQNILEPDDKVITYFKFPPSFKIDLPKAIGNYNPDWGVLRWDEGQEGAVLELVRETKGAENPDELQFPHEKRKIRSAQKYFREVGVDYRFVTDETPAWWKPDPDVEQLPFPDEYEEKPAPSLKLIEPSTEQVRKKKYETMLPVYSLKAAAGYFGEGEVVEEEGWVEVDIGRRLTKKMFVAQVVGKSMEPRIPDGSYCVFRAQPEGTRQGKIVLAEHRGIDDPETGGSYTVKQYSSKKVINEDGTWAHDAIILEPENMEYDNIVLTPEVGDEFKIIAELVAIL